MQILEANKLLETWQLRMSPSPAPFKANDRVREEWVKRLELVTQDVARAAWRSWQNAGHTKWPNLYQMDALLQRYGGVGQLGECANCANSGWVEAEPFMWNNHEYSSSRPCNCDHGKMAERSPVWRDRPMLCTGCKGNGYIAGHTPDDDVELCALCNGDGIRR